MELLVFPLNFAVISVCMVGEKIDIIATITITTFTQFDEYEWRSFWLLQSIVVRSTVAQHTALIQIADIEPVVNLQLSIPQVYPFAQNRMIISKAGAVANNVTSAVRCLWDGAGSNPNNFNRYTPLIMTKARHVAI